MRIKHMFKKTVRDIRGEEQENIPEVPDNLMRKCNACKASGFCRRGKAESIHLSPLRKLFPCTRLSSDQNDRR